MSTITLIIRTLLASAVLAGAALAQTNEPIRIGLLTVKTGPLATGGIQMEQGLNVYLEEHGGMMAGRPVELIVADTGGSPAIAKTKAQELVERDGVDAIIGPLAAYEALAINDYIAEVGVPTLSIAAAEDMTQRTPNPYFIRASSSSAQASHPMGHYAAVDRGFRRAVTIGDDIAYGQEMVAGFQRVFEENGGQVVLKLWPPLNVAEYSAYIAQIRNVDVVYMAFAGANGLRFMRQYEEFGLQGAIPLLGGMTSADESLLKNMTTEALGVIVSSFYSAELDTPANRRFVENVRSAYDVDPGYYAVSAYLEATVLAAGLEQLDGRTDDKAALMAAMRGLTLEDTPRGVLRFDEFGNVVGNIYILEVQRRDGRLVNTPIKTYENISQFWTYDPQEFLSQPVYSRDYPPARYAR
jgi:branched-chain amino acid transport system substrate-binding protein